MMTESAFMINAPVDNMVATELWLFFYMYYQASYATTKLSDSGLLGKCHFSYLLQLASHAVTSKPVSKASVAAGLY